MSRKCLSSRFLQSQVMLPRLQGMLSPKPSSPSPPFLFHPLEDLQGLEINSTPLLVPPIHFLNISKRATIFHVLLGKARSVLPQLFKPAALGVKGWSRNCQGWKRTLQRCPFL